MSQGFNPNNPYASPGMPGQPPYPPTGSNVKGKVLPPAIFLLVVGILGILATLYAIVAALFLPAPVIDPAAPEFIREMQKGAHGPVAAVVQSFFLLVNIFIVVGSVQMMQLKTWGLGLAASILAMINLGSCCCILGLPAGIWGLIILLQSDVKAAMSSARR